MKIIKVAMETNHFRRNEMIKWQVGPSKTAYCILPENWLKYNSYFSIPIKSDIVDGFYSRQLPERHIFLRVKMFGNIFRISTRQCYLLSQLSTMVGEATRFDRKYWKGENQNKSITSAKSRLSPSTSSSPGFSSPPGLKHKLFVFYGRNIYNILV
jgi:hypothetical protein